MTYGTVAPSLIHRAVRAYGAVTALVDTLQPLFALLIRFYLGRVFFASGSIKLMNWDSTLALFANEYHVPILPPTLAAIMGTAAEIGLPVFLVFGLGTRFAAIALFVFNIIAATSYPDLSPAGLKDHVLWGTLMIVLFFYGPGKISIDHWLKLRSQQ